MVNQARLEQANTRLITLSYQLAAILGQMQEQGDIPAWFQETARLTLKQHAAAARARKDALNEN